MSRPTPSGRTCRRAARTGSAAPFGMGDDVVSRALKHRSFWLTLGYVAVILLMARTYA